MEFGPQLDNNRELINDGRLATRILLNERVRELINTVLNALRQSNPDKNYDIFEMANDASSLKKLLTTPKIVDFLDDLINCSLITRLTKTPKLTRTSVIFVYKIPVANHSS